MSDGDQFDENPYATPVAADVQVVQDLDRRDLRNKKLRQILWMMLLYATYGLVSGLTGMDRQSLLELLAAVTFAYLIYRWCEFDRAELGNERWPHFGLLMIICPGPLIIVPVYLIVTRGLWGVVATLIAAAVFVACLLVFTVFAVLGGLLSGDPPF